MSPAASYYATVRWTGGHRGTVTLGNGPVLDFAPPPDAHGEVGVLTPEDAFVAAANTCVMLMVLWAAERFKLRLLSYECRAEGQKTVALDRTETFSRLCFRPVLRVGAGDEAPAVVEGRTRRALEAARKYSLVANSVTADIVVEPEIVIEPGAGGVGT